MIDTILYCKLEQTVVEITPSPREVTEYFWLSPQEIHDREDAPSWLKNDLIYIDRL